MCRQADERPKKLAATAEKIGRHASRRIQRRNTARRRWPLTEHRTRFRTEHRTDAQPLRQLPEVLRREHLRSLAEQGEVVAHRSSPATGDPHEA